MLSIALSSCSLVCSDVIQNLIPANPFFTVGYLIGGANIPIFNRSLEKSMLNFSGPIVIGII